MANCAGPVVVRIRGTSMNSEGLLRDWLLPSEVNFRMVLVRGGRWLNEEEY